LVPEADPTTLFTGSGMQPLISYLLGQPHPLGNKLTNSQKCFRAEDIEEVGDNRHTTFFEMLGNWSLGDYFKKEQLSWFFEFLTKEIGLNPERLYVTVFSGDEKNNIPKDNESVEIWKNLFLEKGIKTKDVDGSAELGMQGGRIFYYDSKKNWWSRAGVPKNMPAGEPGGPDSEVFYEFDQVKHDKSFGENCHPNCDCGRFLEIGNSVFMEYKKKEDGTFEKLSQKNVDFGGGLERIAAAAGNKADMFEVDVFMYIFNEMKKRYGWEYASASDEKKKTMRIVADHLRAAVFMMADGVTPSNKDQGYMVRRLLRRAIFKAYKLAPGFSNLYPLTNVVVDSYKDVYRNLEEKRKVIHADFEQEELKFMTALKKGVKEAEKWLGSKKEKGIAVDAKGTFRIYDTHSVPVEMTTDMIEEYGLEKEKDFDKKLKEAFKRHQEVSRAGAGKKFKGGLADTKTETIKLHTANHLLLAALQKVLGDHIRQRGSNITSERLRIDFSHPQKVNPEQLKKIEDLVNKKIKEGLYMEKKEMTRQKAEEIGAQMEFGAKYGDMVSVYFAKDKKGDIFSKEFCAGPHTQNTKELGHFKIIKEESVASGIRRIKAVLK
jgi:alanyl-tRNA synthetase